MVRRWFVSGGVGMVVFALAGVVLAYYTWLYEGWYWSTLREYGSFYGIHLLFGLHFLALIGWVSVVMSVGLILGGCGFWGYYRGVGSVLGRVSFVIGLVFGWWWGVESILVVWLVSVTALTPFLNLMWIVGAGFVVVLFILWGAITVQMRAYTRSRSFSVFTAVLFLVAAIFFPFQLVSLPMPGFPELVSFVLLGGGVFFLLAGIANAAILWTMPSTKEANDFASQTQESR